MKVPTIIGTGSFAASGGSALTNILEEFSSIIPLKGGAEFECKFFTENILNLELALKNNYGVDNAVKAFLFNAKNISHEPYYCMNFGTQLYEYTEEYIASISDWYMGAIHKNYDYAFLNRHESKMFTYAEKLYNYKYGNRTYNAYEPYHWEPSFIPFGKVYYADFKNDFYQKTQAYIEKVFSPLYTETAKYILSDLICTATFTTPNELMYYKNAKALIANRDPRDLYVINKEIYGEWYMPTWDVDNWIKYYRYRRQCIRHQKENNTDNILHFQFEELIYNYEKSLTKIKQFLSLSDAEHVKKGEIFIPEKSKTNTQLFRKYPQYAKDIDKIERELPEFCYPYTVEQIRYFIPEQNEKESLENIRKDVCIFQKTGKLPFSNSKAAYLFTAFYELFKYFKNRKTSFSMLKGIVKIIPFLFFLPFDFLIQLRAITKYQKEHKDVIVEFK